MKLDQDLGAPLQTTQRANSLSPFIKIIKIKRVQGAYSLPRFGAEPRDLDLAVYAFIVFSFTRRNNSAASAASAEKLSLPIIP